MAGLTENTQERGPRTAEHDKLNPFAGLFRAEVKLWMGPGDPMVSAGTMVNEWILGGRFLKQTYKGDPVEGPYQPFEGTGYWGYSATSGEYQGYWIDNASTWMQLDTGTVDAAGKIWTMHSSFPNPQTGKPMNKRTVITLEDQDHHRVEAFFSVEGGDEVKSMELSYARKK